MKGFFDYYRERMENNHNVLMQVAEQLKARGCKVYSTEFRTPQQDGYRSYIVAEKDGKRTYVGFAEVPYRWYVDASGSSHGNTRYIGNGYEFPYTIDEVLSSMQTAQKKLFSFYVEL